MTDAQRARALWEAKTAVPAEAWEHWQLDHHGGVAVIPVLLVFPVSVFAFKFYGRVEAFVVTWLGGLVVAPVTILVLTVPAAGLLYWLEHRPGSATWARKRIRNLYPGDPPAASGAAV